MVVSAVITILMLKSWRQEDQIKDLKKRPDAIAPVGTELVEKRETPNARGD